jgi:L,D-transpeptidase ErfK/SrfK
MSKASRKPLVLIIAVIVAICPNSSASRAATLPYVDDLIGDLKHYTVRDHESLIEIARKFDLGYNAIVDANPGVDPIIPSTGTMITIPTSWIVPAVPKRPAIVINIPEFRLYYVPSQSFDTVETFPLGIGDEGMDTPTGNYTVVEKIVNPAWHVPKSIRAQSATLPEVVPPGPENPMGSHALRLSRKDVLIHGTNRPWGIGRRSSHGCLRLYPEDIVRLFSLVSEGMPVEIVNQPIKVSTKGRKVFVEAHQYEQELDESSVGQAMHLFADRGVLDLVDFAALIQALQEKRGVPVDVTLAR